MVPCSMVSIFIILWRVDILLSWHSCIMYIVRGSTGVGIGDWGSGEVRVGWLDYVGLVGWVMLGCLDWIGVL